MMTPWGIVVPKEFLDSAFFGVLSAFVAFNTIVYTALAVAKMLPKVYLSDLVKRHYRRAETRSIDPDAPAG